VPRIRSAASNASNSGAAIGLGPGCQTLPTRRRPESVRRPQVVPTRSRTVLLYSWRLSRRMGTPARGKPASSRSTGSAASQRAAAVGIAGLEAICRRQPG
jgi:hypothetical protein